MMKEGTLIVFHLLIACIFIHVSTEKAAYGKRIGIEARNDCPENERLYSKGTKIEKINGRIVRVEYYTTCHYLCKGKRNNIADGTKCLKIHNAGGSIHREIHKYVATCKGGNCG
ncbi:uncharacterized protein LOC135388291 isoform X2 [Ornithodoros turicata]|uniref:uncharacterized protein LOC135388291 isoform X2 n=1 Tax=Ornithodoros turicata TaxID=34597 RepID=UPI0031390B64